MKSILRKYFILEFWEKILFWVTSIFLILSFIFALIFNIVDGEILFFFSIIASFMGILGVLYAEKRNLFTYFTGLVHVLLYGLIAFVSSLYGDFLLNILFFIPMQFVGYFIWRKNLDVNKKDEVKVVQINKKWYFLIAFSFIAFYGISFFFLNLSSDPAPFADSTSTTLSIVGMFLMVFGLWEQWVAWIVVNLATIFMWFVVIINSNDLATLPILYMWCVYLLLSIVGLIKWKSKLKTQIVTEKLIDVVTTYNSPFSINKEFNVNNYNFHHSVEKANKYIQLKYLNYDHYDHFENNNYKLIYNLDWMKYKQENSMEEKWLVEEQLSEAKH